MLVWFSLHYHHNIHEITSGKYHGCVCQDTHEARRTKQQLQGLRSSLRACCLCHFPAESPTKVTCSTITCLWDDQEVHEPSKNKILVDSCNSAKANINLCLAKALMKQEHWRLFTCNFGISNKTEQVEKGYKNMLKLVISIVLPGVAQHGLTTSPSKHNRSSNCSAKPGLGLRLRIRLEKSYQSRHHQRHSQRQLQSVTASHHLLSRLANLKRITQEMLLFTICLYTHECIQVSKPIQNLIIRLSSAEQRKLMTWSRV